MMPNTSQKYGFLLLEDFSNMVLASAVEPLRAANYCASRQWFSWQLFSLHGQSVTSSSGLRLLPDAALAEAGADDAHDLAEKLALLKEGAISTAHVRGMPEAAQIAKTIARTLIDAQCVNGTG